MKKIIPLLLTVLALASCGGAGRKIVQQEEPPMPPIGFRAELYECDSTAVKKGENFISMFQRFGLSRPQANALALKCADSVFNYRLIRAGVPVQCYYSQDTVGRKLEYAVYQHSRIKRTVFMCGDSLAVWNYIKPTRIDTVYRDVLITRSLTQDAVDAGVPVALAYELSSIYEWTVDFFKLHDGDRFQVVFQRSVSDEDGEVLGSGPILFSRFTRYDRQVINAIRFEDGRKSDKYFEENGHNLRKAFLKAPLDYKRVSSHFSYARKHPVTGKVRPHTGVDYAAPMGTPVRALGDGQVVSAGWTTTGGGYVVKIQHSNGYMTGYLHLKGFAKGISKGAHVRQGQTIGYVGSTGTSTGPHLDFRVWKNGTAINPEKMVSPSADPLTKDQMPKLQSLYDHYLTYLQ